MFNFFCLNTGVIFTKRCDQRFNYVGVQQKVSSQNRNSVLSIVTDIFNYFSLLQYYNCQICHTKHIICMCFVFPTQSSMQYVFVANGA